MRRGPCFAGEFGGGAGSSEDPRGTSTDSVGSDWFVERAAELGLDFVHFNGASGHFYYPEILPPGVGLLDYDNDGDLDVFLVQGRMLGPDSRVADALIPPASPGPLTGRLYRNDLEIGPDGSRSWRFVDVTEQSGPCTPTDTASVWRRATSTTTAGSICS